MSKRVEEFDGVQHGKGGDCACHCEVCGEELPRSPRGTYEPCDTCYEPRGEFEQKWAAKCGRGW